MTEQIPQWAVERARELAALWNDPGQEDAIARALADAAPGWRTDMENAPDDGTTFIVGTWVKNTQGEQWWESYAVWLDDETGEISASCDCPWSFSDFEHWMPLPAAPEVG